MADQDLDQMLKRIAATKVNRRGFLWAAGLTGGAAALAACAPGATTSPSSSAPAPSAAPSGSAPAASVAASPSAVAVDVESELLMYNWADYVDKDNMAQFQKDFKVEKFTYDTFANNDEMMAKFQGGATGQWDICAPTANYIPAMRDQGFLQKLDLTKVPNVALIDEVFKKQWWDPTDEWQVPKDWGTTGISVRTKVVKEEVKTWQQFFEVAPSYSGRIVVVDSPDDVFIAPLKALGYSLNSGEKAELDAARDLLLKLAPHILALDSDTYDAKLRTEEAVLGLTWTGGVLELRDVPETADTQYYIPEDGTAFWMDAWVILAEAPHPNAAHAWLNFIQSPEPQAKETMTNYYATCNSSAKPFIDAKLLADPAIFVPDDVLKRLEGQKDNSGFTQRADIYEEFKSKIGQA